MRPSRQAGEFTRGGEPQLAAIFLATASRNCARTAAVRLCATRSEIPPSVHGSRTVVLAVPFARAQAAPTIAIPAKPVSSADRTAGLGDLLSIWLRPKPPRTHSRLPPAQTQTH